MRRRKTAAIGLNAKCPRAGRVKTRLCPPLTPEQAARLYEGFLEDLMVRLCRIEDMDRVLFYDPPESAGWFEQRAGDTWELVPQSAGDLGVRLAAEAEWMSQQGYAAFVLLGSDAPTLPLDAVRDALNAVRSDRADVVLGPDQDGGYYLAALRRDVAGVFDEVSWSTPDALADTEANVRRAGRQVLRGQPWFDVDTDADLERLRMDMDDARIAAEVPCTAGQLRRLLVGTARTGGERERGAETTG